MSDETGLEQLLRLMMEMTTAIKTLAENQSRLAAEQDHCGKAIGEFGIVLHNHAETLRYAQDALTVVWKQLGLPIDQSPQPN